MSRMKRLLEDVLELAENDFEEAVEIMHRKLGYKRDYAQAVLESYLVDKNDFGK